MIQTKSIRIKFIVQSMKCIPIINMGMYTNILNHITSSGDIEIVDDKEDIIHAFGIWNPTWTRRIRHIRSHAIPVIFTSICGQEGLYNSAGEITDNRMLRNSIHKISVTKTNIHVCGESEKEALSTIAPEASISIIHNVDYTMSTTLESMIRQFVMLYKQAIVSNDNKVYNEIEELLKSKLDIASCASQSEYDSIIELATKLLYLKHLLNKRSIPQSYLDDISKNMMISDYNEELMRRLLEDMKEIEFASYAMTLISKNSLLTEGFMPIQASNGKIVETMENCIYNNIK